MTTHGEVVGTYLLTIGTDDVTGRNPGTVFRLGDDLLGKTSGLVGLGTECDALNDIVELQRTSILGDDDSVEGIPLGYLFALLNHVARLEVERGTVGYANP